MNQDLSDEEVALVIRALENYYSYTVATKSEDVRYKQLAERLKRKPTERVAAQTGRVAKRKA